MPSQGAMKLLTVIVKLVSGQYILRKYKHPLFLNIYKYAYKNETSISVLVLSLQVYYTPAGQLSTNSTTTRITLSDLVPGVQYSINVTAVTTTGGRITSTTVTATTCEFVPFVKLFHCFCFYVVTTALFQIRLRPIGNCLDWIVSE